MKTRVQLGIKNNQTSGAVSIGLKLFWVQCKGHNCLAYTDAAGKWINFYTGKPLTNFVRIIG